MNDMLKTVSLVSKIFGVMGDDLKSVNKWQKRFYEKIPGISFPENWDQLSEKEKRKRLDKIIKIGMEIK